MEETMSFSDKWQAGDGISASLGCAKCGKVVNSNEEHQCNEENENEKQETENKSNYNAG
jgi:hypothetical protein